MNVLITGAKGGIGYNTALELLNRGHFVYLTVHTDEQLETLKNDEVLKDKQVELMKLDITNPKDRNKIKDLDIDVLINNAAIGHGGSIITSSMDRIRDNYEVNFFGTVELTKIALSNMIKKDSGKIVVISSLIGEIPFPWLGIYSSTKAALTNLFMALDKELKETNSNIKIVIIEPGFYHTGFNQVMMDNKYNDDKIFKDLRDEIHKNEEIKLKFLESEDLKSIVDKIVDGVEAKKPSLIYRAPFVQSALGKMFMIVRK